MSDELPVSISNGENVHSWYFTSLESDANEAYGDHDDC